MSGTTTKNNGTAKPEQAEISPERIREVNAILARARGGDESVLPELQKILDEYPGIWITAGNLAAHARTAWIRLISGRDFLLRESLDRDSYAQIAAMTGRDASPLERLLAERVVTCRLQLSHADHMMTDLAEKASPDFVAVLDKRITVCQKRLSAAVSDLARHQKIFGRMGQTVASAVAPPPPAERPAVTPPLEPAVPARDADSIDMSDEAIEARLRKEWDMIREIHSEVDQAHLREGHNGHNNRIKGLLEPTGKH